MSIYLEFPAIADYPVYTPLNQFTAIVPGWIVNAVKSCMSDEEEETAETTGDKENPAERLKP